MARSLTEFAKSAVGGTSIVVGLLTGLGQLTEQLDGLHEHFQNPVSVWVLLTAAAVLVLVGLSLLRQGLSHKSRLLRPEALLIDPDNPSHLHGCDEEIRRLATAVAARPLVFLEGESGSGKSALVRSGLIPALRLAEPAPTLLPIYVNSYPGDWEQGLAEQLVAAAWRWLGDDVRDQLGITTLDDTDAEIPKARTAVLEDLLAAAGTEPAKGGRMLDSLEQSGVIRPRVVDGAEESGDWWSLYHDYLAKAVLAAHRRANFWYWTLWLGPRTGIS